MATKDKALERLFSGFPPRQETAIQRFESVDSAPVGYSSVRSAYVGPAFLLSLALASGIVVLFELWLRQNYAAILGEISGTTLLPPPSLGVRPIILSFVLTFWLFTNGDWAQKINLFFFMAVLTFFFVFIADLTLLVLPSSWGLSPFSLLGHIISGYAGLISIAVVSLASVRLPEGIKVSSVFQRPRRYALIASACLILSISIVVLLLEFARAPIDFLRTYALLGGVGPGLLLFYPIISLLLAGVGAYALIKGRRPRPNRISPNGRPYPSVGVVVPAYNESIGIAECLRSLDEAAAEYGGSCHVYVVDNGSTDNTLAIAVQTLAECRALTGGVFSCPTRGKANALNYGVSLTSEAIVLRLDSDTLCSKPLIAQMVKYFSDPTVGMVGGLPLPKKTSSIFRHVREIEVYHNVGFSRIAQSAIDSVTTVTGVVTAYRREPLLEAGDFSVGINGEDTDMTIRIGRLGYRVVVDPDIKVFSEVPGSWAHLKEQRIRWSRSIFHSFARNCSAIWLLQGVRGLWFLPNSVWSIFRRLLVVLILVYLGVAVLVNPSVAALWPVGAVGALIAGPSLILTLITLLIYRKFSLIPFLPAYLVFRLARAYIVLEMLFTLSLKPNEAEERELRTETA